MSADEFTSVQWDRDDTAPQRIYDSGQGQHEPGIIEEEADGGEALVGDAAAATAATAATETAAPTATPTATPQHHTDTKTDTSTSTPGNEAAKFYTKSTVGEPLKESDGSNSYITYLIHTRTDNPVFQSKDFQIRRRFSDFSFLYQCFLNDFPTVVVPPLPNKQRLEYIKGDRFSEHFTTKRAISLNNFLSRVSKHEVLRSSKIYQVFLENSDYWNTYKQNLKLSGGGGGGGGGGAANSAETNDRISDFIMNAFKKPASDTQNSKEFQEIVVKADKLHDNLAKIDKVYAKVLKKQGELAGNFAKFGDEFGRLNRLINDNVEESSSDLDHALVKNFKALADNLQRYSGASNHLTQQVDYEYLTSLKDLEHYIVALKNAVKLKDSKLLDYEALVGYLGKARAEKQAILQNGAGSTAEATLKFLSRRIESFTGADVAGYGSATSVNAKILKLNSRIAELERESADALDTFHNFEQALLKEYYSKFEVIKTEEIDENLQRLADLNLAFYGNVLKNWVDLDDSLLPAAGLQDAAVAKLKLREDSELFEHPEIAKNEADIEHDYDKLVQVHEERLKEKQEEARKLREREEEEVRQEQEARLSVGSGADADAAAADAAADPAVAYDDEEDDLMTASMLG